MTLANGNTVSITLIHQTLGNCRSVKDLADILNSGITPGGNSFHLQVMV